MLGSEAAPELAIARPSERLSRPSGLSSWYPVLWLPQETGVKVNDSALRSFQARSWPAIRLSVVLISGNGPEYAAPAAVVPTVLVSTPLIRRSTNARSSS